MYYRTQLLEQLLNTLAGITYIVAPFIFILLLVIVIAVFGRVLEAIIGVRFLDKWLKR